VDAEILIVGDPDKRGALAQQVGALGYGAELIAAAGVEPLLDAGTLPRVIVVCIDDVDPPLFMAQLRRMQRGAAIPVTLCGHMAGSGFDLADVLDLGADHFLEEPISNDALASALDALAGPPLLPELVPEPVDDPPGGSWPTSTEVIEATEPPRVHPAVERNRGAGDAAIGQLHRTLDLLGGRRSDAAEPDDLDLAALGFGAVPELDGDPDANDAAMDPAESHDRLEVAELRVVVPHPVALVGERGRLPIGPRETTVLLEDSSPLSSRGATANRMVAAADGATGEHREPTSPAVLVTAEFADRPRRRVPLPLEREGDLSVVEVPRLLSRLHRASFTGRLDLGSGRVEKSLWMDGGAIVFARSTAGHDRLIDGLLRCGMLTRPQYEEARRRSESDGRRAGQVLVETGFLKHSELHTALQEQLARIVDSTLPWREGRWTLFPDARCEEAIQMTTPTAVLLVDGIRQRMEPARLLGLVGGPLAHPRLVGDAAIHDAARRDLAGGLRLLPGEEAWLPRFDGRASIAELLADPGADEAELLTVVYALHVLELVELHGEPLPTPHVAEDPVGIDRGRIEERLALAREADYFALLGLERTATRAEVRTACSDLTRTFSEPRLEPAVRTAMAGELAELRAALTEAREVLEHDMLRNAYLAQLEDP
jgi:Domain of unknown function (DUF4388)